MTDPNKSTTKEKILKTAARLFSERGFDRVTVREIAREVGVNSGSLYNHFVSKEEILKELYALYSEHLIKECPDLEELLAMAETSPPHEVLMKTEFHFSDDMRKFLNEILISAARRICCDEENVAFIWDNIFAPTYNILKPLLERMVELGKIKPFDIDIFLNVMSYYCFASAALNNSPFRLGVSDYQKGFSFIFSAIVPVED